MKFSVIIPVYEEGPLAAAAVEALRRNAGGLDAEIILPCAGRGAAAVPDSLPPDALCFRSPKGRALQMNQGAGAASGDVLVFLHADTSLPPGAFQAIERALGTGAYCGGAFRLKLDSGRPWLRFVAWSANIRNLFTGTPYGDQAIFMKAGFFRALGGYREIPIMEDVDLVRRARAAGGRLVILKEYAVSSARRWEKEGLLGTTLTNHALRLLYLAGTAPEKLAGFRAARGVLSKLVALR